jgi:nicotinate phosphoribosyltransferase
MVGQKRMDALAGATGVVALMGVKQNSETCDIWDMLARIDQFHHALTRFPASLFQFDPRMGDGWYADRYFVRTRLALLHAGLKPVVTMQVFAKEHGVVAGAFEVIRMLETQLTSGYHLADLTVDTLIDGDVLEPWVPVMHITGPYDAFAHLETDYLGVLARRSLIASNVRRVIEAARGRPVVFMGARHDDWRVQTPDGYAAQVGGAGSVSSDAGGAWWGARGVGTMPHALIAAFGGDVVSATLAFADYVRCCEPDVQIVSLVDYRNDVITDALAVARAVRARFGEGVLSGVRVDTSEKLTDVSQAGTSVVGVNPALVRMLRDALDGEGFHGVGIIVSGGFTPARIREFEAAGVPVAGYGVGSSLLGHNRGAADGLINACDFTADIVRVNGVLESKVGRAWRPNPLLVRLDPTRLGDGPESRG